MSSSTLSREQAAPNARLYMQPAAPDRAGDAAFDWHIGVFCRNEEDRIGQCIAAIDEAVLFAGRRALVTVLVNGSTDDSFRNAAVAARAARCMVQVITRPAADKSSAINSFYAVRAPGARLYFSIDGYVLVARDALALLEAALTQSPDALAASGSAANGRTMVAFTQAANAAGGQICGGMHALRPEFLERMTTAGIRLPAGLYRGDGLLGFMARANLDPAEGETRARVVGVPQATFQLKSLSARNPRDLTRQFQRKLSQMRGRVENAAIKHLVSHHPDGFKALPGCAYDMMRTHLKDFGPPKVGWLDRPFMILALWQIRLGRTEATVRHQAGV